jgi:transcription initiation factor TFIIIB Brf1 subunit/transcription initiation factor TFIIB
MSRNAHEVAARTGEAATRLGLGPTALAKAKAIAAQADRVTGFGADALAGAAIHIAGILTGDRRDEHDIAAAADVAVAAMRQAEASLAAVIDIDLVL